MLRGQTLSVQQYKMAAIWHLKFVILNPEVSSKEIEIIRRLFLVITTVGTTELDIGGGPPIYLIK